MRLLPINLHQWLLVFVWLSFCSFVWSVIPWHDAVVPLHVLFAWHVRRWDPRRIKPLSQRISTWLEKVVSSPTKDPFVGGRSRPQSTPLRTDKKKYLCVYTTCTIVTNKENFNVILFHCLPHCTLWQSMFVLGVHSAIPISKFVYACSLNIAPDHQPPTLRSTVSLLLLHTGCCPSTKLYHQGNHNRE